MRKSNLHGLVALAAAGMFSTALMAGDPQHAATFESLDKNSDQQISKAEAQADKHLSDGFASADTNGDGYLNKMEWQKTSTSGKDKDRGKKDSSSSSSPSPSDYPTS